MRRLVMALVAIAGVLVAGSLGYATTYNTPTVDGTISISASDWDANELVVDDPSNDSYWGTSNEIDNLYLTWDADNLYIGVDYTVSGNAMIIYLHIGGSAWYSDTDLYGMDFYPRNFRFRPGHGAQVIIGGWDGGTPGIHGITGDNTSSDISSSCTISGGPGSNTPGSTEIAIPWNTLYGLGVGVVPANAVVEAVAVIAGGDNWGSPDSAPDNADCNGDGGPDSLIALHTVNVDHNWDGTPEQHWNPATNSSNLLLNAGFETCC